MPKYLDETGLAQVSQDIDKKVKIWWREGIRLTASIDTQGVIKCSFYMPVIQRMYQQ